MSLFLGCLIQFLAAADAPAPASKAEFVYPDFTQCYEKNRQSIVYFGTTRAVAVSEKQAVAYAKEKPSVPYVRYDYLSNLYLFESPKPLIPVKLKSTSELKLGEWLESLTDKSLIVVNASKVGANSGELFEFAGKGEVNSIVGGLCCEMYGLGIGEQYFIASEVLQRFIEGKSLAFKELGARFTENNESVVVDAVDPNFKEAKIKVGDKITALNGVKVKTLAEFNDVVKNLKEGSKLSAQIQRDNAWIEENLLVPKPQPKKVEPKKKVPLPKAKKESYLQTKGFAFDKELRIINIAHGSFAEQSGLKVGDRLMQIETTPINSLPEADAYLTKNRAKELHLLFDRDDFQFFVTLKR
jgi:hypothetical protein